MKTSEFHIVFLYLSKNYDKKFVFGILQRWIDTRIPTAIMGDINENCAETSKFNDFMQSGGFRQLVQSPTHRDGGILDHLYINEAMNRKNIFFEINCCYFSDHDVISLYIRK